MRRMLADRPAARPAGVVLEQVCPNVPDMPIGVFMENFGNDFAATLEARQ